MYQALLIRTATRWRIKSDLASDVISRDEQCVYCRRKFEGFSGPRRTWPSWEHIVNDAALVNASNIALCCLGCNASKGTKSLETWLASNYCAERGITSESIAAIALMALKSGGHRAASPSNEALGDDNETPAEIARDRTSNKGSMTSSKHEQHRPLPVEVPDAPASGAIDATTAPELKHLVGNFHRLIRKRQLEFNLPPLSHMPSAHEVIGSTAGKKWFSVPGMYGGFSYQLGGPEASPKLVVKSWSRVVEGSEQTHEVTGAGFSITPEELQ